MLCRVARVHQRGDKICATCRARRCATCHQFGGLHAPHCLTLRSLPRCRTCALAPVHRRGAHECRRCLAERCPICRKVGGSRRHPGRGLRAPRVRRNEVTAEDFERMVWASYGVGWRTASRIVGKHEGFDIAQDAITKVWALRSYLRVRELGGYYVKTCWSLAIGRARRRWRESAVDGRMLERAQVRVAQREDAATASARARRRRRDDPRRGPVSWLRHADSKYHPTTALPAVSGRAMSECLEPTGHAWWCPTVRYSGFPKEGRCLGCQRVHTIHYPTDRMCAGCHERAVDIERGRECAALGVSGRSRLVSRSRSVTIRVAVSARSVFCPYTGRKRYETGS